MRYLATILFILLIVKTTLAMDVSRILISDCCKSEQTVMVDEGHAMDDNKDSDKKDCCDYGCYCLCCVHILFEARQLQLQIVEPESNFAIPVIYKNNYKLLLHKLFWHPPKDVQ